MADDVYNEDVLFFLNRQQGRLRNAIKAVEQLRDNNTAYTDSHVRTLRLDTQRHVTETISGFSSLPSLGQWRGRNRPPAS